MFTGSKFKLDARFDERTYRLGSWGLVLCAAALRLIGLDKGIWQDEGSSIALIRQANFWSALRGYDHPPLYFTLLKFWSQISDAEPFLRLLSVPFSLLAVIAVMVVARRVSTRAAMLAGWTAATLPILLRYGQEIRGYALLLAATALAFYFATRMLEEPGQPKAYLGLAASLVTATLTHLVGIFLPASIAVYLLIYGKSRWRSLKPGWSAGAFALPAAAFAGAYFVLMDASIRARGGSGWGDEFSPQFFIFTLLFYTGLFTFLPNLLTGGMRSWNIPGIAALTALTGSFSGLFLARSRMAAALLLSALVFWGQEIVVALVAVPVFSERAALPGLIPLIVFAAIQMAEIPARPVRNIVIFCVIALGLISSATWITRDAWKSLEPWRELSSMVRNVYRSGDLIAVYPGYASQPLRYYLDDLPASTFVSLPLEVDEPEMEGIARQGRVFLITRLDGNVERDWIRYERLVDEFNRAEGKAEMSSFGNLRLYVYPARK